MSEFGEWQVADDEEEILCPQCHQGHIHIAKTIYKLPLEEETLLLLLITCDHCDLVQRDVLSLHSYVKPGTFTYHVTGGDLTAKIFRSPGSSLEIPEFGVEIEPGPKAQLIITNVEGILENVIFATKILARVGDNPEVAQALLPRLEEARQGMSEFTVILKDFVGGSFISHEDLSKVQFEEHFHPTPEEEQNTGEGDE
ncbi:MAG TPA: ZPR1 zinc finger domain-containing protein [Candidatus Lokiarchaeia archaeon]|nr:ZPR1 zinc finger domain-containing protein [Candidatus Lokiarchaeia archaeon]